MITYVDLFFPSGGPTAADIARRLREEAGLSFLRGPHDLSFRWKTLDEFTTGIEKVHQALSGTGVIYRFVSHEDEPATPDDLIGWPPLGMPGPAPARRDW